MSTVIAFPTTREITSRSTALRRPKAALAGPKVVILPVVRIERHAEPEPAGEMGELLTGPFGAGAARGRH